MHEKLKTLVRNTKEIFSDEDIDKIARKTKFIKRIGKIDASTFLAFNTLLSDDMCSKSLVTLCGRLAANYGISISPQALNERFNNHSVDFMRELFNNMILNQNDILKYHKENLTFKRILLNDATGYSLPDKFSEEFKGSGGSSSKSAIKIQLQYDLLSGKFLCCDFFSGTVNDYNYLNAMAVQTMPGDLRLADLGYFKVDYFKEIDSKGAFYISKLKSTTSLYEKNKDEDIKLKKNGSIIKSSEFKKIDIFEIIKPLADGETIELKNIYIGSKKELKSRLIITKLSEENKSKRLKKQLNSLRTGRRKMNERNMAWTSVNVYITNIPETIVKTTQIHDIYSLRWQIEIMFKVWKSIFNINDVKNVKIERFKCFLYGRLISLLLASKIVFAAKDIIYEEYKKEVSILKSYSLVNEYFKAIKVDIFKSELKKISVLTDIISLISRLGTKCKKKGRKTVIEIIKFLEITETEFEEMGN